MLHGLSRHAAWLVVCMQACLELRSSVDLNQSSISVRPYTSLNTEECLKQLNRIESGVRDRRCALEIFDRLLLALDLTDGCEQLLNRVLKFCIPHMDRVHVVHVLDDTSAMLSGAFDFDIDPEYRRRRDLALTSLNRLLETNRFNLSPKQIFVRAGEPATEIKRLAQEIDADLVIVGSRSRNSGWISLPGTTTNCVLQGIQSDVMAVRV